jgi:hypothetical protein
MNRRFTSQPIGEEVLTTGERLRRANVAAAVFPIDPFDAIRIHEYLAGHTDSLAGGAWDRIDTIGWVA